MRIETLPSPGVINHGLRLRTDAAAAISYVETMAGLTGGTNRSANTLKAFFTACADALTALVDGVAPAVVSRAISAAAPTKVVITFAEDLDATSVPPASAFTLAAPTKTISSVTVSGKVVTLTVSAAYVVGDTAPTVAFTQGATKLKDVAGNEAANFTAAAVARVA